MKIRVYPKHDDNAERAKKIEKVMDWYVNENKSLIEEMVRVQILADIMYGNPQEGVGMTDKELISVLLEGISKVQDKETLKILRFYLGKVVLFSASPYIPMMEFNPQEER